MKVCRKCLDISSGSRNRKTAKKGQTYTGLEEVEKKITITQRENYCKGEY